VVPLPPEEEKETVVSMEIGTPTHSDDSSSHDNFDSHGDSSSPGTGKHHEILARVKELLIKQADQIKSQEQEIKRQRERLEQEVEGIRAELEETKQKLADLRSKADEDDQAIADLASFVREHTGGESSSSESEAA
jgi:predicted ribosome quality control (RQC) complex YloA/Tae2 family protein